MVWTGQPVRCGVVRPVRPEVKVLLRPDPESGAVAGDQLGPAVAVKVGRGQVTDRRLAANGGSGVGGRQPDAEYRGLGTVEHGAVAKTIAVEVGCQ